MALRDLAGATAARGALEGAAVLLGAARRNLPVYGFDPEIWNPIQVRCRQGLGPDRFQRESDEGFGLDQDEAIARVHAARAVSSHGARPRRRTMLRALARPEGFGRAGTTRAIANARLPQPTGSERPGGLMRPIQIGRGLPVGVHRRQPVAS